MGAALIDETHASLFVSEQNKVFAQRAYSKRQIFDIFRQLHRLPIAAQELSHGRATADFGQLSVIAAYGRRIGRLVNRRRGRVRRVNRFAHFRVSSSC